jgi:hypothetical protein
MTQILVKVKSEDGTTVMEHRYSSNEVDSIKDRAMRNQARIVLNDGVPRSVEGPNGVKFEISIV